MDGVGMGEWQGQGGRKAQLRFQSLISSDKGGFLKKMKDERWAYQQIKKASEKEEGI